MLAGAASVILWSLFKTDYMVTTDTLRVRYGPLRWSIPLSSIQSVQPSRSIISSQE